MRDMSTTQKLSYDELLRKALGSRKSSSTKKGKFDQKKNYSSFWMDDLGKGSDRFGISSDFAGKSNDLVKSIKLNSYRKAIANFVKILTNKEIPVRFQGTQSYTDGKSVTLSTDLKDDNFDVSVGLALHEASHILLTDFTILPVINGGSHIEVEKIADRFPFKGEGRMVIKEMLNWVEDRRIDNYVFSTSPGYKAYYHKLYDHYFNNDAVITKALKAKKYRNNKVMDSWMMHIVNMTNANFNPNAFEGLKEVAEIVDLANISRLKSTNDSLEVVFQIMDVILMYLDFTPQTQQPQPQPQPQGGSAPKQEDDDNEEDDSNESESQEGEGGEEGEEQEGSGSGGDEGEEGEGSESGSGSGEGEEFSDKELADMKKQLEKQKSFTNGEDNKKSANRNLTKKLEKAEKDNVSIEQVGGKYTCINYDFTGKEAIAAAAADERLAEVQKAISGLNYSSPEYKKLAQQRSDLRDLKCTLPSEYFGSASANNVQYIDKGLLMGQLLGKKLQMRNESRERIDNRLTSGKVDNRRLAAAGYGIESIFHQVTVDKYKKANIHLSLDGSGSMAGGNWNNTLLLSAAIAKAITYTQNVTMQISIRVTLDNLPANITVYDSRKNTIREMQVILSTFRPNGMTPEGLCFESMLKKNQLVRANSDMDSYFVNISDGAPGGIGTYYGDTAKEHTKAQITKMRNELGMNVLSYFMTSYVNSDFSQCNAGRMFQGMYGKAATQIQPDNVLAIAKTLNNMFMGK